VETRPARDRTLGHHFLSEVRSDISKGNCLGMITSNDVQSLSLGRKLHSFCGQNVFDLKTAYGIHFEEFKKLRDASPLYAYQALAVSIEIYLKIHVVAYTWVLIQKDNGKQAKLWNKLLSQKKSDSELPKKSESEISIDLKTTFSHNILALVRDLETLLGEDLGAILKEFLVFGTDWTTVRYNPGSKPNLSEDIKKLDASFEILRSKIQDLKLCVLDRITEV
jgi:hypothetical protein